MRASLNLLMGILMALPFPSLAQFPTIGNAPAFTDPGAPAQCAQILLAPTDTFRLYRLAQLSPSSNRLHALWFDYNGMVRGIADNTNRPQHKASFDSFGLDLVTNTSVKQLTQGAFRATIPPLNQYLNSGRTSPLVIYNDVNSETSGLRIIAPGKQALTIPLYSEAMRWFPLEMLFYAEPLPNRQSQAYLHNFTHDVTYSLPIIPDALRYHPPSLYSSGKTLLIAGTVYTQNDQYKIYLMKIRDPLNSNASLEADQPIIATSLSADRQLPPRVFLKPSPHHFPPTLQLHVIANSTDGTSAIRTFLFNGNNPVLDSGFEVGSSLKCYPNCAPISETQENAYLHFSKQGMSILRSDRHPPQNIPIDLNPLKQINGVTEPVEVTWHRFSKYPSFAMVRMIGKTERLKDRLTVSDNTGIAIVGSTTGSVLAYYPLGRAVTDIPLAIKVYPHSGKAVVAFTRDGRDVTVYHLDLTPVMLSNFGTY